MSTFDCRIGRSLYATFRSNFSIIAFESFTLYVNTRAEKYQIIRLVFEMQVKITLVQLSKNWLLVIGLVEMAGSLRLSKKSPLNKKAYLINTNDTTNEANCLIF